MNKHVLKTFAPMMIIVVLLSTFIIPCSSVTWETENRITTYSGWDILPYITQLSNGSIWLFWQCDRADDFDIVLSSYNFTSGTFTREKTVFSNPDPSEDISPSFLQLKNGTMLLFWSSNKPGNYDLYKASSNDNGKTWTQATSITQNTHDDTDPIAIQAADGTIWLVWQRDLTTSSQVIYKTYSGGSWSGETVLSTYVNYDELPYIAQMRDGRIWVVWGSWTGDNFDIMYRIYNGASWSGAYNRTQSVGDDDSDPCIVQTRDGTIWILWASSSLPNREDDIYYQTSLDNGQTWSSTTALTTYNTVETWPSAAQMNDKKLWVVYVSSRNDNYDLYYTKAEILTHDVAITNVVPSKTEANRGETLSISVTVQNQGDFSETFTVKSYADSTQIGSQTITLAAAATNVLVFPWDTLSFAPKAYVIKANATTVIGENPINLDDNSFTDGTVNIVNPDIAVLSVSASETTVFQGIPVLISITVKNEGSISASFTVSAYRNSTLISSTTVSNLAPGATKVVTINWDTKTTPPSQRRYQVIGKAGPLPGEIDTADNTKDDGMVLVKIPGDVDADGNVDIADMFLIAKALGTDPEWPPGSGWNQWNPECDINRDNKIDVFDLATAGRNYGMIAT